LQSQELIMKATSSTSVQRQQTKHQFTSSQGYLNYELGKAIHRLPPLYTRILGFGICTLVGGTITWAALSKVDEVAIASGQIIPSVQVQPMRSLASGLLREIKVTEGTPVKKGDVLVQLDPTMSQADVDRLQKLAKQSREILARLDAERKGTSQAGTALQNQLLMARLREFRDRQTAAAAEVNRQRSLMRTAQVKLSQLELELAHTRRKGRAYQSLVARGGVPRFDYLDARIKADSLRKDISVQWQELEQAKQSYQAARSNATRLASERQSEILTHIEKQRQDLTDLEGKLTQAQNQHKQSTVHAAVSGTVYNIKATKAGATVQPGEELLSIVPEGEELILEAKVLNQDIGFVRPGMRVKIKLATFPYQEFGMVEGTISKISPNAVNEPNVGLVFPVQVRLRQQAVQVKGQNVAIAPGMEATAEIVTRQKTVLSFLLDPITASWDRAFSVR
jgi:HlyD family secretion protein